MRQTEQRLWDRMRANMPASVRLERVENMLASGFPDVWALSKGATTPIELKAFLTPPVRAYSRAIPSGRGLSVDQRNWHLDWQRHGGVSLIILALGARHNIQHYVVTGHHADEVNDWPIAQWSLHNRIIHNTGPTFWAELASYLAH